MTEYIIDKIFGYLTWAAFIVLLLAIAWRVAG